MLHTLISDPGWQLHSAGDSTHMDGRCFRDASTLASAAHCTALHCAINSAPGSIPLATARHHAAHHAGPPSPRTCFSNQQMNSQMAAASLRWASLMPASSASFFRALAAAMGDSCSTSLGAAGAGAAAGLAGASAAVRR